jgi:hypothetical protein
MSILTILLALTTGFGRGPHAKASDGMNIQNALEQLTTLNNLLDGKGYEGLLSSSIPCPAIYSKYYVDIIVSRNPELRELEYAKRSFGLKLAGLLEKESFFLQNTTASSKREKRVKMLLNLANWIALTSGYGNYILYSRCENLITVALAFLTYDLDFPLEKITALRSCIKTPEQEQSMRIKIINAEAPYSVIGPLKGNVIEQSNQMEFFWNKGWRKMVDYFNSCNITVSKWHRDKLPDDLKYFLDDKIENIPPTTVGLWDIKQHETFIYGHRDVHLRMVDAFILYREKVGRFPTQPPPWYKAGISAGTAIENAFEQEWRPFRDKFGPIGVAATVYQQILENRFYDRDLFKQMRYDKRRSRR